MNFDHLLVIISARRGSISYDSSFEKLPAQISKYFANNSLIVLYPDQLGEPQDAVSFSNPRGNNESQHYEKVGKWFYKWKIGNSERNSYWEMKRWNGYARRMYL